jgi:probable rRNA maturation factor
MIEINNTTKFKINEKLIKKVAEKFLESRRLAKKEVSIAFIGEARMRTLNKTYRKKDKTTDVLSFEGGDRFDFGEIVINPAQIKRQAKESDNTFEQELFFILVHGLLHLAGYNDETEKDRLAMIKLGEKFIGKFKI